MVAGIIQIIIGAITEIVAWFSHTGNFSYELSSFQQTVKAIWELTGVLLICSGIITILISILKKEVITYLCRIANNADQINNKALDKAQINTELGQLRTRITSIEDKLQASNLLLDKLASNSSSNDKKNSKKNIDKEIKENKEAEEITTINSSLLQKYKELITSVAVDDEIKNNIIEYLDKQLSNTDINSAIKLQDLYFNTSSLEYMTGLVPKVSDFNNLLEYKSFIEELKKEVL